MPSKTEEKPTWKKATMGDLPPLVILQVGEEMTAKLVQIDENNQGTAQKPDVRTYYRFALLDELSSKDKDGKPIDFGAGEIVSLPGSGALNYTMRGTALLIQGNARGSEGFKPNEVTLEAMQEHLTGHEFKISRKPDEKMPDGKYKNKPVKKFDVEYR